MDSGGMDMAINMIPSHFDRLVFLEYVLEDFDFRSFSRQSGIPVKDLYHAVGRAKSYLREILKRK